jgi:probable HAF family extracellular repeat protein
MRNLGIGGLLLFGIVALGGLATASAAPIYSFTTIDVPGALQSRATGINDSGQIVGSFQGTGGVHGFLATGGSFTTFDVLGAGSTFANGINDSGRS